MSVSSGDLRRLVDAGVIDDATADRIAAFELADAEARRLRRAQPTMMELAAYLGVAVVGAGVTVLVATNWEQLTTWSRLATGAVPALLALVVGQVLRVASRSDLVRAAGIAWLLAAALSTATVAIAGNETGWAPEDVVLAAGVAAVVFALALWWISATHAQLVGLAGAVFLLSIAFTAQAGDSDIAVAIFGISLAGFALTGLIAAEARFLVPRGTARLLSAAGLAIGAVFAGLPPAPAASELVALFASAILVAAGLRYRTLVYAGFGVATAFAGLVTLILRHVENSTLAALALIVVGVVLLIGVAIVARMHVWRAWHGEGNGTSKPQLQEQPRHQ